MTTARTALLALLIAAGAAAPLAAAVPAAAIQPGAEARQVDLRPKFRQGQEIRYTMQIDSTNDVTSDLLPELDDKQVMRQQLTLLLRVVEAGSDGATVQLVYERVKVDIESEYLTASYDSAQPNAAGSKGSPGQRDKDKRDQRDSRRKRERSKPQPKPDPNASPNPPAPGALPSLDGGVLDMTDDELLALAMHGIAGTVVTIDLDANGNVVKVSGADSLSLGGAGMGGLGGPCGLTPIGGGAGGSWMIASPGQSGFANVGQTWTTTSTLAGTPLGTFEMITRYTLRSAAGGRATIGISGGIDAASNASRPGGSTAAQVREARYSGQCIWDTSEGCLSELTTSQSAIIEGAGLGVPMVMKSTTDTRVRRVR